MRKTRHTEPRVPECRGRKGEGEEEQKLSALLSVNDLNEHRVCIVDLPPRDECSDRTRGLFLQSAWPLQICPRVKPKSGDQPGCNTMATSPEGFQVFEWQGECPSLSVRRSTVSSSCFRASLVYLIYMISSSWRGHQLYL